MRKPDTSTAEDLGASGLEDLVTIEAPTVEEAMSRLAAEIGESARIVSAEKVGRGGIGGFFAKEMVVLTAQRPEADRTGLPGVLERMSRDADLREQAFGDVLRREMAERTPDTGLGSLLAAAGWSDETPGPSTTPAGGTDRRAGAPVETAAFPAASPTRDRAPVSVGPLLQPVGNPPATEGRAGPMAGATIAERMAGEHLVMTPDRFIATTFPFVTSATGSDAPATVDIAPSGARPAVAESGPPSSASNPSAPTFEERTFEEPTFEEPSRLPQPIERSNAPEITAPTVRAAVDVAAAPPGSGRPAWSVAELVRRGLPGALVTAVRDLDPRDDMAWIEALAAAVEPWCGPLPDGDRVVVGTGADRLGQDLDLPLVRLGDVAPYGGSFCSVLTGATDDRAWLDLVRGGRRLHFVLGEDELWRDLLVTDPSVVSWVSPTGLVDALYLASTLGARLGYGSFGPDEPMVRCQPVDVALAIRRLVGRD